MYTFINKLNYKYFFYITRLALGTYIKNDTNAILKLLPETYIYLWLIYVRNGCCDEFF